MIKHQELASGRWFRMSLAQQLGNVGSEYEMALRWQQKQDEARFSPAFQRFLELLDLTVNDPRWSVFRKRELLRLREVSCAALLGAAKEVGLTKYFYDFALLARRNR